MSTPLLTTKLYIPPVRPGLVARGRLVARLEEAQRLGCALTLVSAPAGFGKTTLLSAWITAGERQPYTAWVSLDEDDNDPARFWSYLIAALQTLQPELGLNAMGVLQSEQASTLALEPLLIALVNDISAQETGKQAMTLVLDDYHAIRTGEIHKSLEYLLHHLPPGLRLVIASREDPPLSLPLLRGRGQLLEIRSADLRFRPEETGEFLAATMGLNLSSADIAALGQRTEGWAVGLQMAALMLQGQSDPQAHALVSAFSGDDRYVADYLLEQVLNRQTAAIQRFLLQTSILDRLCGPLCDAMLASDSRDQDETPETQLRDSQEVLEYLERAGLFVIPLDNRRQWYRYHHLFADLLRSRLLATSSSPATTGARPTAITALHRRASDWFAQAGLVAEAMEHVFAARDFEGAADLIQRFFKETVWTGEYGLVSRWLAALPADLIRKRPFLCIINSLLALGQSPPRAEAWLQTAEQAWEDSPKTQAETPGPLSLNDRLVFEANLADIRAIIRDRSGTPAEELVAFTTQALEKTPDYAPSLRASMLQRLGWYHLTLGDEAAAERYFSESLQLGETAGHYGNTIGATIGQVVIAWGHGRLRDAAAICQTTLQAVVTPLERAGRRLPVAGDLFIILGRLQFELGELETAEANLIKGVELIELTTPARSGDLLDGYHTLACLRCLEGDCEGAFAWMERAERKCTWAQEGVQALWARLWLWRAQVEQERQYLDRAVAWAGERKLENPDRNEWELHSLALASIAGYQAYGKPDLAPLLNVLEEQVMQATAKGRDDLVIYMLALEALAWQALGQMEAALNALRRALPLAADHGFVMTFVCHSAPMEALLREASRRGIASPYADRLLAAFPSGMPPVPAEARTSQAALVEPLSKRELEVLRLLDSNLSGPQIADELYISLGTFQTHTKNIYGKLGVHNRRAAITRASELKLL